MGIRYLFTIFFCIILWLYVYDTKAEWYDIEDKRTLGSTNYVTITNNDNADGNKQAIEPIKARSQIECVLACKTRYRIENAFYLEDETNYDKRCFCLQKKEVGNVVGEENINRVGNLLRQDQDKLAWGISHYLH